MALDAAAAQELIRKLNADRELFLDSVNKLVQAISASGGAPQQPHRLTADTLRRNVAGAVDVESVHRTTSAFSGDDDSESSDAGASLFASEPLAPEEYDIDGLKKHIREHKWTDSDKRVLWGVCDNEALLQRPSLFPIEIESSDDRSHLSHFSIYDVADDGTLSEPVAGRQEKSQSLEIWERLRSTNTDSDDAKKAVGRLTIIREPSPLLFAALHYTMRKHFDMDEIFKFLVDDDPALVRPYNPFHKDERQRKTMVWNAEYFTIVGENCIPMKWQRSDADGDGGDENHIPISRCSATVALSFEGDHIGRVKSKDRRLSRRLGYVYDPFSPWRVLAIMCYPDWISTIDDDDDLQRHKPVNGPEAFLTLLRQELRDAFKRLLRVHRRIEDLIQPPPDFIFSQKTRDRFLFEDTSYTLSRRYFWASQTLGIMNQDIEEMIESYEDVFNEGFWMGTDKIIWPGTQDAQASSRNAHWRKRMALLRMSIEEEIRRLRKIEHMNEKEIKKIIGLREELFSGTSVEESRKSVELAGVTVEQGFNIKILTLVTIFFTPAMFVVGCWGMTNMDPNEGFGHFGIALVTICLPTYLLILHVNTAGGLNWWERALSAFSLQVYIALAKFVEALLQRRTPWTAKYLQPRTTIQAPLPPGRRRHTRTLSSSSMELGMGLRSRGPIHNAAVRSPPMSPSMSRTATAENGHSVMTALEAPQSPISPLAHSVTWDLNETIAPDRADTPVGLKPLRAKAASMGVEQVGVPRDVEEGFSLETPSKTFLDRLRSRRNG